MRRLKSRSGNTLISVMVASGIMAVLMYGVSSMLMNVNRETFYVQQKMDSITAQSLVTLGIINNNANCTLSLEGKAFNTASPPTMFALDELVLGPALGKTAIVKTSTSVVPGGLVVDSIQMKDILPDGPPGNYKGNIVIKFNNNIRKTRDLMFPLAFKVNTTTNLTSGCGANGPPASIVVLNLGGSQNYPANSCPAGWIVTPTLTAKREGCNSNTVWVGVAMPRIDGALRYDLTTEFGSAKGGSSGHGWNYFVKGLSQRQFLSPAALDPAIAHTMSLEFYIGERTSTAPNAGAFIQFIAATSATVHPCIKLEDVKMMIECLK